LDEPKNRMREFCTQRHGFLVRQDNDQLIASFEFTSEAEAQAAQNLGT
jgi:hypothetical protein